MLVGYTPIFAGYMPICAGFLTVLFGLESCPFCWLITQSSFCWFILSIFLYSKHHFSSTLDFHMWTILDWPWHKGFLVKVLHRLQTAKQMQKLWSGTRDGNLRICSTWCGDGSAWDSTYRGAFLGFTDANPFTNYISGFCLDDRRDHILFGDFLVSDHWVLGSARGQGNEGFNVLVIVKNRGFLGRG